jgi:hypothetical protein
MTEASCRGSSTHQARDGCRIYSRIPLELAVAFNIPLIEQALDSALHVAMHKGNRGHDPVCLLVV